MPSKNRVTKPHHTAKVECPHPPAARESSPQPQRRHCLLQKGSLDPWPLPSSNFKSCHAFPFSSGRGRALVPAGLHLTGGHPCCSLHFLLAPSELEQPSLREASLSSAVSSCPCSAAKATVRVRGCPVGGSHLIILRHP